MALILGVIQQAARDEPELAALWAEIAERRAANMRLFVADGSRRRGRAGRKREIVVVLGHRPHLR